MTDKDAKTTIPAFDVEQEIQNVRAEVKQHDGKLITILSSAYEIYYQIVNAKGEEKKQLTADLKRLMERDAKESTAKTTHTKVVQLIFDSPEMDRRRVSAYAAILRNANKEYIKTHQFANWVKQVGGIDKASKLGSPDDPTDYLPGAIDSLHKLHVADIEIDTAAASKISEGAGQIKLVFCIWNEDESKLQICKLIADEKKVQAALRPFAKSIVDSVQDAANDPKGDNSDAA